MTYIWRQARLHDHYENITFLCLMQYTCISDVLWWRISYVVKLDETYSFVFIKPEVIEEIEVYIFILVDKACKNITFVMPVITIVF